MFYYHKTKNLRDSLLDDLSVNNDELSIEFFCIHKNIEVMVPYKPVLVQYTKGFGCYHPIRDVSTMDNYFS